LQQDLKNEIVPMLLDAKYLCNYVKNELKIWYMDLFLQFNVKITLFSVYHTFIRVTEKCTVLYWEEKWSTCHYREAFPPFHHTTARRSELRLASPPPRSNPKASGRRRWAASEPSPPSSTPTTPRPPPPAEAPGGSGSRRGSQGASAPRPRRHPCPCSTRPRGRRGACGGGRPRARRAGIRRSRRTRRSVRRSYVHVFGIIVAISDFALLNSPVEFFEYYWWLSINFFPKSGKWC
jgi:hypothetical protein